MKITQMSIAEWRKHVADCGGLNEEDAIFLIDSYERISENYVQTVKANAELGFTTTEALVQKKRAEDHADVCSAGVIELARAIDVALRKTANVCGEFAKAALDVMQNKPPND